MLKEAKISSLVSLFPLPQYVVVLEDLEKTRLVPIWIGVYEGNAIALEIQKEKFPRPLTHDLLVNIIASFGAHVEKVVITDLKENSYYAHILIRMSGHLYEIDARPSDSLAVAVRVHCPIFIEEKVLLKCPPMSAGPITAEDIERFKEELKGMSAEEFFKRLEEAPPASDPSLDSLGEGEDVEEEDDNEEESDPNDK